LEMYLEAIGGDFDDRGLETGFSQLGGGAACARVN